MKILMLNGSHNKNGETWQLLNEIKKYLDEKGFSSEIESVHEAICDAKTPFCTCCSSPCSKICYKDTKLDILFNKVTEADFVVIGSPVYFGSMSAQLKAFFDKTRAIRADKLWLGKPVACVSVGASKYGGQERTIDHIHSCCMVSGMNIFGNGSTIGMGHFGLSGQKPVKDDTYAMTQAKSMAEAMAKYLTKE